MKRELAQLKARLGSGEKRQKKKEALVGVSYTVDTNKRSAWEAHMQRERILMNRRLFDAVGYPDDFDAEAEDLYLLKLTGS